MTNFIEVPEPPSMYVTEDEQHAAAHALRVATIAALQQLLHDRIFRHSSPRERRAYVQHVLGGEGYWQGNEWNGFQAWRFSWAGYQWRYLPWSGPAGENSGYVDFIR